MPLQSKIISISHQFIENLNILDKSILENNAESEIQKIFTFTKIGLKDVDSENQSSGIFELYMNSNKMKYQGNSFAWYRNRNIPSIKIKRKNDQENQSQQNKKECSGSEEKYTFYINAFYIDRNKISSTRLKGDQYKQDSNSCQFNSLKFEKTSYILNGSLVRLFIVIFDSSETLIECHISSPIHISSWKNYLKDKPSKSAIFSPFMPAILQRVNVIQQGSDTQKQLQNDFQSNSIIIYDSVQGLSDYFKGSTIKQKVIKITSQNICHPLFLSIKFSRTIKLYFSQDLLPTSQLSKRDHIQVELLINIHRYFIQCLSTKSITKKKIALEIKDSQKRTLDDKVIDNIFEYGILNYLSLLQKVRDFLSKIYSEYVHLISKKNDNLVTQNNFVLLKLENLNDMQLAYKIAYPQLELMLLSQQEPELQKNQQIYYHQDEDLEKEENSDNLYFIPKVEITLNSSIVNPNIATRIPVQYSKTRFTSIISQKGNKECQRISNVQRFTQKQTQKQTSQINQINLSKTKQSNFEYEPNLKKKLKISFLVQEEQQMFLDQRQLSQNKQASESPIRDENVIHIKDSSQFSSNSQSRKEILYSKRSKQIRNSEEKKNINYKQNNESKKINNKEIIQIDEFNQIVKKPKNFTIHQEFKTVSSMINSNSQKQSSNQNFLMRQHQKIQDFQNFEQLENQVSEQSPFQSSQIKSQVSNIDYMNVELNTLQLNNNQSMNITQVNHQQTTHTLIGYDEKINYNKSPYQTTCKFEKKINLNDDNQIYCTRKIQNNHSQQKIKNLKKLKHTSDNKIFKASYQVDQNIIQIKEETYQDQIVKRKIDRDVNNFDKTSLKGNKEIKNNNNNNNNNINLQQNTQVETLQHHQCLCPTQHYQQQFYQQPPPFNQTPLNPQPVQYYFQPPYQQMQIFPIQNQINNYQPIIYSLPPNHNQHIN